jgi:tripartite-type tricarboxylate transporter receptor subunit TctC
MARFFFTGPLLIGLLCALLSPVIGSAGSASAQGADGFPRQPVRIIVPFAAGGAPDTVARLLAQYASDGLGRVFVENITGGAGNIAMQAGARAAPDGYTVLMCTLGCASNLFLLDNMGWDPRTDIAPVMLAGVLPNVLVVGPSINASSAPSVKGFIELARAKPGSLSMASSGIGSASHLAGEMFKAMAAVEILHVPYRGSTAALPDIVGGRVDSMIVSLPEALQLIQSGQLRALGVSTAGRSPSLPDVPTISEAGVAGYAVVAWSAMFVPKATPAAIVTRLNAEFDKALQNPLVKARLAEISVQGGGGPPEKAAELLQSEIGAWGKLIKERNIKGN